MKQFFRLQLTFVPSALKPWPTNLRPPWCSRLPSPGSKMLPVNPELDGLLYRSRGIPKVSKRFQRILLAVSKSNQQHPKVPKSVLPAQPPFHDTPFPSKVQTKQHQIQWSGRTWWQPAIVLQLKMAVSCIMAVSFLTHVCGCIYI